MTTDSFDYCVMGNPVQHSRSPWIHARFAELTGQQLVYGRQLVPLDAFVPTVQAFIADGGQGCNVTVPFKFEAFHLATTLSERARMAQAANTLHVRPGGIHADNTDGAGLVQDIQQHAGVSIAGRDLLLIGAGGAAAGVLAPLIEAGARRIAVANRTVDKAQALVARHAALATGHGCQLDACGLDAVTGQFGIVVNATASSLAGAQVPVPATVLAPGALAVDMMYGPAAAGFLAWARAHGATARDGLGMLVEQAAESFALWRGVRPPSATVLAELRALVDG
ncbi:shikimate dehydrogenase [Pseudorhodoferax sp. Leaf267]|uniref:shikimate dehydrogenase n=1 Tax=Pseudorhodoferax sp. Leaf267 TaxID=1736316 RepID=UPI0006F6194B|nr:shikimate dehydrogenase [Pseudorhodoferax sp. Leaf267]KQP14152.1 shikimate dehydrogenase [Pseudorhodoferax sp. Leaf267]